MEFQTICIWLRPMLFEFMHTLCTHNLFCVYFFPFFSMTRQSIPLVFHYYIWSFGIPFLFTILILWAIHFSLTSLQLAHVFIIHINTHSVTNWTHATTKFLFLFLSYLVLFKSVQQVDANANAACWRFSLSLTLSSFFSCGYVKYVCIELCVI